MANQDSTNSEKEEKEGTINPALETIENIEDNQIEEIKMDDESQLEFMFNRGIVKNCALSMPITLRLSGDKLNLFLPVFQFEEILLGHLEEVEDVREGFQVNLYDKDGHEFQVMLKKWVIKEFNKGFYTLNRGWNNFCVDKDLKKNDLVALRTFRHAITNKLSFLVTCQKMK